MSHSQIDRCQTSNKYEAYIKRNLESLKAQCGHVTACIDKLLAEVSVTVLLKGDNISLNKTCGLIHKSVTGSYTTLRRNCTETEREEIRGIVEEHVGDVYDTNKWKNLKRCLTNTYGDSERTTFVQEICGLAQRQKEICNNSETHRMTEKFFNEEIQSLQCTCRKLEQEGEENVNLPIIIGVGVGGFLLLVILCVVCLMFYRSRKSAHKNRAATPNVIYLPGPSPDAPVYQEIYDNRVNSARGYCAPPPADPPSLPVRYLSKPTANRTNPPSSDEPDYLEPVVVAVKYRANASLQREASNGMDSPPTYSQCERDSDENNYFDPLPSPTPEDDVKQPLSSEEAAQVSPTSDLDGGYETLARDKTPGLDGRFSKLTNQRSSCPPEEAPKPLGPVPVKRAKKEDRQTDRQTEPHYFVLEENALVEEPQE